MSCSADSGKYTLTNIFGCPAVFDIDADTIDTDSLENFAYTAYTLQEATEGVVYSGIKICTADYSEAFVPAPALSADLDFIPDVEHHHPADL